MVTYTFRTLERITVQGYRTDLKEITLAYCQEDGNYYLLEDPTILNDNEGRFRKVSNTEYELIDEEGISIITTTVSNKDELYKRYVRSFARNALNPFKLLKLYRQGLTTDIPEFNHIFAETTIPDDVLELFISELDKMEKTRGKRIVIDVIDVLKGLETAYRLYKENKELFDRLRMTMRDVFNDCVDEKEDRLVFITATFFIGIISTKIEQERIKKEKEEKEKQRQEQEQQQQAIIKNIQQAEPKQNKGKVTIPLGKMQVLVEDEGDDKDKGEGKETKIEEEGEGEGEETTPKGEAVTREGEGEEKEKEKEIKEKKYITVKVEPKTEPKVMEIFNFVVYISAYEEPSEGLLLQLKQIIENFLSKRIKLREVKVYGSQ
jgi:hypothetical protein